MIEPLTTEQFGKKSVAYDKLKQHEAVNAMYAAIVRLSSIADNSLDRELINCEINVLNHAYAKFKKMVKQNE